MSNNKSSWNVERDDNIPDNERWGFSVIWGHEMRVFLQAKDESGFWVQIDPDGPYRLVDNFRAG